jgi:hypothetical protein
MLSLGVLQAVARRVKENGFLPKYGNKRPDTPIYLI